MKHFLTLTFLLVLYGQAAQAQTNYALVFGNPDDYVSIPNAAASSVTTKATFEVWVKPATDNETCRIIDNMPPEGNGFLLDLLNGYPRIVFTGSFGVTATTALSAGQWYHIAVTASNTAESLNIYINGILNNTSQMYGGISPNSYPVYLGRDQSGNNHFMGAMDEVRIWNYARTASQIKTSMNHNLTGSEDGLIAYWPMNEGTGTTACDLTTNANNGTLVNFSLTTGSGWVSDNVVKYYNYTPLGDGSSSNPYQIATLNNLYWLSQKSSCLDKYFIQTADINADSTRYWDGYSGFSPIGNSTTNFTGNYNGKGHTIDGLYINRSTDYIGLFGYVGSSGIVDSLSVSNSYVSGGNYVGALAGKNEGVMTVCSAPADSINGISLVGGLVGWNEPGNILLCYSSGTVTATSTSVAMAGGLAGWHYGNTISNSYSLSTVTASNGSRVGGLVGFLLGGTVTNCYATGGVNGTTDVGGLVGLGSGTATNCFYNCDIFAATTGYGTGKTTRQMKTASTYTDAGWDFAGETTNGTADYWGINSIDKNGFPCFTGQLKAPVVTTQDISNYTVTTVTANGGLGYCGTTDITAHGFCWSSTNTLPTIEDDIINLGPTSNTGSFSSSLTGLINETVYYIRAYATNSSGTVYGEVVTNLPAVTTLAAGTITSSTAVLNGSITCSAGGSVTSYGFCWSNTNTMPTIDNNSIGLGAASGIISFNATISNLESASTWYVRAYARNLTGISYGASISFTRLPVANKPSGSGTSTDPFLITNLDNLYWISQNSSYWESYFVQTTNIDAGPSRYIDNGSGFSPIGKGGTSFKGSYNGRGYVIKDLYINRPSTPYIGLFGYTYGATIDSLGLTDVSVKGLSNTGSLAGYCKESNVTCCYSGGNVSGTNIVGGLIGLSLSSKISNCYSTGNVSGTVSTGGLVGTNQTYSTISNCYSTANISGSDNAGGFIGYNISYYSVINCYSAGMVSGSSNVGGFLGYRYLGTVKDCYYNKQTSGQSDSYATGLTTAQMRKSSSFTWGIDTSSVWCIRADSTYPALKNIDNAPFTFADTISGGICSLSALTVNDFDYENLQANMVTEIISIYSLKYSKTYSSLADAPATDSLKIVYRAGEVRSSVGDTLWGNQATSIVRFSNKAPVCTSLYTTIPEDTKSEIAFSSFASDPNDDALAFLFLNSASLGTVTIANDTLLYTPHPNLNGNDTLQVIVSDGTRSSTGYIYISVTPVNDAPVLSDVSDVITAEDTPVTLTMSSVTATDVDGDALSLIVYGGSNYSVSGATISPDENYNGTLTVTVAVTDGTDTSNTMTMTITVTPVTDIFTITASAGDGGSISPSGGISVVEGGSQSLTITANTGYIISDVLVDGSSVGKVSSYSFNSVAANHTITASFELITGYEEISVSKIKIFPNPCSAGFTIETGEGTSMLCIYDLTGKLVLTKQVSGTDNVNIESLKTGVYVIRLNEKYLKMVKE